MKRYAALAAAATLVAAAPAYAAVDNPDVSIVGDFRYKTNFQDQAADLDRFRVEEVELALQGYLSPWSRADVFLSRPAEGGLEVEEGFLTLNDLPLDLKARIGKFKVPFGKLNPVHPEGWVFVDAPLVMRNLLGDEGWNNTGAELSGFIPNPWDLATTATLDVVGGENDIAFNRGPMGNLRLTTYLPVTDDAGLELGASGGAQFTNPTNGLGRSSILGLDARYRWAPGPSTSFTVLGEYMQLLRPDEAPSGEYLSADYQWATAHDLDLRLDRSYAPGQTTPGHEVSLTYGYSIWETTRFKLQATHAFGPTPDNRVIFQTLFVLGPHKHALNF